MVGVLTVEELLYLRRNAYAKCKAQPRLRDSCSELVTRSRSALHTINIIANSTVRSLPLLQHDLGLHLMSYRLSKAQCGSCCSGSPSSRSSPSRPSSTWTRRTANLETSSSTRSIFARCGMGESRQASRLRSNSVVCATHRYVLLY